MVAGHQPKRGKDSPNAPPKHPSGNVRPKPNGADAPLLTRDAILAAPDLPMERVKVPEWGGEVMVRALPFAQLSDFEATAEDKDRDTAEVLARMVALAACDADGRALFTLQDVHALMAKARGAVMRVAQAAIRVNAITDQDVEDLAKN